MRAEGTWKQVGFDVWLLSVQVNNGYGGDFCIVFGVEVHWSYEEVGEYFGGDQILGCLDSFEIFSDSLV